MRTRYIRPAMILAGILMAAIPALASAYVGPGAGITAIGSVLALLAGILLAIVGFIWYPLKRFFRSRSGKQDTAATQSTKEHQDDPDKS